jgi:Na+/melibiose symporter-like transporter
MIAFISIRINDIMGHTITAAVYTLLMILGYGYIYWITAGRDSNSQKSTPVQATEARQTVREIVILVFKNPPLLLLIIAEIFRNTSLFFVASFAFYYFGYVLNNSAFMSGFILSIHIAALLGTFAAVWIGVKIGKRNSYWLSLFLGAVCFALAIFVGGTTWGFTVIFGIGYMFSYIAGSMTTALFADTAIYGEWKTGKSIRGFTMALLTLPIKVGLFLRAQIIALGLVAIGFIANTVPAPNVVRGISYIMIIAPAAASAVAAAIFYFGYKIDDKHILRMQDEIAALRGTALPAAGQPIRTAP